MAANPTWAFQLFQGPLDYEANVKPRSGQLIPFGLTGDLLMFDVTSLGGFTSISPAAVVTIGTASGASITASSISLLTEPGQILSGAQNGGNSVLSSGTNGYILTSDSTSPSGLSWTEPASQGGVVQPLPNSVVQRDGTAIIYANGFVTTGPITPGTGGTYTVGTADTPFPAMYATTYNGTTAAVSAVTPASGALTLSTSGSDSVVVAPNGTTMMTFDPTSNTVLLGAGTAFGVAGIVVGGSYGGAGTWYITVDGSGNLSFQYWNGSAYVASGNVQT